MYCEIAPLKESDNKDIMCCVNSDEDQCLLTCKATLPDGQMVVQGPLQALPGSHCTTASGDEGICVNSLCTVSLFRWKKDNFCVNSTVPVLTGFLEGPLSMHCQCFSHEHQIPLTT